MGLELTPEEHRVGWGNDQCFQCHQVWVIHAEDCLAVDGADPVAVNDEIDPEDPNSCVACHGTNGSDLLKAP